MTGDSGRGLIGPCHRGLALACAVLALAASAVLLHDRLAAPALQAQGAEPPPIYLPLGLQGFSGPFPPAPTAIPASPTPSLTPTPSETPEPSATPTETPTPEPSATPTPAKPAWQARVDHHRALAGLGPVEENPDWSRGGELHSRYMVKNDYIGHSEQRGNPWFTEEGLEAAENGNVTLGSNIDRPSEAAVDYWMVGPFHQVAILDPQLRISGFGEWREAIGTFQYGATLDVLRGRTGVAPGTRFPLRYPDEGKRMPLLEYPGGEDPDPLTSCSGYTVPTGPPLVLILGAGDVTPRVSRTAFADAAGTELPHCWFDQTNYRNANRGAQELGRGGLAMRSAIILMPRAPLEPDTGYTVTIVNAGTTHRWSFRTEAGWAPEPGTTAEPPANNAKEAEAVRLINLRRGEAGLPDFRIDPALTRAAQRQSQDMAQNGFGGHLGSDGSTPESRMRDAGYPFGPFSVDFATGSDGDPAKLVEFWMSNPTTRAHILSDKAEIGLGYATNPASRDIHFWYVHYASRR